MSEQAQAARNLIQARRHEDAVKVLLRALATGSEDYQLHSLLAQAYLGMGQPQAALRAANDAARLAPEAEWPHRLGSIALRRLGKAREAVAAAGEAVRLAPETPEGRHTLAEAYLQARQVDAAYAQAYEARRLSPEDADMYDLLGRCMLRKHMYKDAEAAFRYALQLEPNNAAAHNNLGVVLEGTGRRVDAVNEFNEAARLDPSFEQARRNLYSSTRFLVGGGSLVFLIYLVFRLAVVVNLGRQSLGVGLVGAAIIVVVIGFWVRRNRLLFVRRPDLPATAVAYYKAEQRRLRIANRPVFLLRVAGVPTVIVAGFVLALVLDQPVLILLGASLAVGLYLLSPWAWRRFVRRPG